MDSIETTTFETEGQTEIQVSPVNDQQEKTEEDAGELATEETIEVDTEPAEEEQTTEVAEEPIDEVKAETPIEEDTEKPDGEEAEKAAEEAEDPNERDFDKNPTVLFALLQKKEWEAAIERAGSNSDEASVWVSRKEKDGRLRWRLLPIHAAIVFKAPENVIEALLKAFPKGAETKDDQGMLPIHLSFRNAATEGTVKQLLAAYPNSIDVKDRKGRVPLVLAQASSSPYKDAYLRALERECEPSEEVKSAAATERATVTAEQRAIFDTTMMQMKETHEHEMAALKLKAENKEKELQAKLAEMEQEFLKSQETSQILVDHVNSLEAQLNTRSDTERFLATKIATLDTSLKSTEKGREEVEFKLRLENEALIAERDGYKSKYDELESALKESQTKLTESVKLFEKREEEFAQVESDLQQQVKTTQIDWANAQANCAILDAQLKKKMETEHSLASQVSALAGKLAENASDSRDNNGKFTSKIKELEAERLILRSTVQDLTKRLKLVARVLEDMTVEQAKIVENSLGHEAAIAQALEAHAKIVSDAVEQQQIIEAARRERQEIREMLKKQEEQVVATEDKRSTIMSAIVVQGEHMAKTRKARDDMMETVKSMGDDCKLVLSTIRDVLPTEGEGDHDIVDIVCAAVNPSTDAPKAEEEKKEDPIESSPVDAVPVLAGKPLTQDDEQTATTEKTSRSEMEDAPSDRIMAARDGIAN